MLDLSSAVVLGLVVLGLVTLVRSAMAGGDKLKTAVIVIVIAVVAVFLVSASDFASEEVVLDRPLDSLNVWSQLVVAILLAGVASAAWEGLKAVANVGENRTPTP